MKPNSNEKPSKFFDRVSVYGLEFAVAMITLVISVSVLSFAAFALCNYLAYENVGSGRGYFALWSSASTIVWVPVALIFYLRSRAYMARNPEVANSPVQRVFTLIYDVLIILTIISFAVAAVYAVLTSLVKPDETADILLGMALPSAISAALFGGALISFFKTPIVRRRTFAVVFSLVAAIIVVPTIAVSVMTLRGVNADETKEADLYSLKSAIDDYENENNKLPESIADIETSLADDATKNRLDTYTFKKIDSSRYRLCADFTSKSSYASVTPAYENDSYRSYVSFSQHKTGENCYKLRVSGSSIDYGIE